MGRDLETIEKVYITDYASLVMMCNKSIIPSNYMCLTLNGLKKVTYR